MVRGRSSVGVFTTDCNLIVQTWDAWLVDATGLSESAVCGVSLARLYPELAERGLLARLRRVAEGSGVDVLAPALHKFLLPCKPRDRSSRFERMRQHVTVAPLRGRDAIEGIVVTIEDVTQRFDRDRRLAADLDSEDEATRLLAARTLAADREAPALLSEALSDRSWRVRRVAAEGMAAGGGREVVDTLVEALREHHRNPALLNAVITAFAQSRDDAALALAPLLDHDDADIRMYTSLALGLMDDQRVVPALVARLGDVDANVRYHVIEALGRIGDRRAVAPLVSIADGRDFFLAFPALDALASIGDGSVAHHLLPLLDDELLLPAALACLGALGTEDVVVPLARLTTRPGVSAASVAEALAAIHERVSRTVGEPALVADFVRGAMTPESARVLLGALDGATSEELRGLVMVLSWLPFAEIDRELAALLGHDAVRELVAERLGTRGVSAASHVEALAGADAAHEVRVAAAFAMGRIGSRTSVPTLIAMLGEGAEPPVLIAAAGALGAIGDGRAFAPLLALMDHSESMVRQAAVGAVNSIGHPRLESTVSGLLHEPSPRVRESAARVAGYFGYRSCLRRMVELCEDDDPMVRRATVESLGYFDQRAAWSKIQETAASDEDATVRAAAVRAIGQWGPDEPVSILAKSLRDPNLWVRYYAARACVRTAARHADIVAALLECAVRDQAAPVRIAAIDALGSLVLPSALEILLGLVHDPDADVSSASIAALGHFEGRETTAVLAAVLEQDDARRQHAALDALAQQGASADDAAAAVAAVARRTRDEGLRRRAIQVLGSIGAPAAIEALASFGSLHRYAELVTSAVANSRAESLPAVESALVRAPDDVRILFVEGVARMKREGTTRILAAMLDDRSAGVRLAAARGLGRLDLRDARTQLDTMARTDESVAVRAAAHDALTRG